MDDEERSQDTDKKDGAEGPLLLLRQLQLSNDRNWKTQNSDIQQRVGNYIAKIDSVRKTLVLDQAQRIPSFRDGVTLEKYKYCRNKAPKNAKTQYNSVGGSERSCCKDGSVKSQDGKLDEGYAPGEQ